MLDSKKVTNENELELLHLENKKMDGYLQILKQKQDLELKYLEQLCEQRSRVDKLGEKYPHIEIKHFWTYPVKSGSRYCIFCVFEMVLDNSCIVY